MKKSSLFFNILFMFFLFPIYGYASIPLCRIQGTPWLEGRIKEDPSKQKKLQNSKITSHTIDARIGQEIEVFVVAKGFFRNRPVVFSEDGQKGRVSFQKSGCEPLSVSWRKIEPWMGHVKTKSPNPNMSLYANAVVFGPHHGKWIGFDQIEYFETPLPKTPETTGPRLMIQDARPTIFAVPRFKEHENLGTMRLAATIKLGEQEFSTKGAKQLREGQISDEVFRYSFRSGDGFLGWLTSYFNVPYLFGSVDRQVEKRIGADCADILVAALHLAGKKDVTYTNVGGLIDQLRKSAGPTQIKVCTQKEANHCKKTSNPPLYFGKEVKPGDILALNYTDTNLIPRAWDHIVVLVEDRGPDGKPDGILGPQDIIADSGDEGALNYGPLGAQGNISVVVARPKGVSIF